MYQPRSRPSIFGVASIDLFASALGAFVILTIVSLPFFMNSGKNPEEPMVEEVKRLYRQQQTLYQQIEQLQQENERLSIHDLELLLLVDFSNSYANFLDGLEYELRTLSRFWHKRNKQLRIGLILYGDRKTRYPILKANFDPQRNRVDLSEPAELIRRIRNESFLQNNDNLLNRDGPEALDQALDQALQYQWSLPKEQRYLFVHYDNICYPDRMESCHQGLELLRQRVDQLYMKYTQTPISADRNAAIALAEAHHATFIDSGQSWTLQIFDQADLL